MRGNVVFLRLASDQPKNEGSRLLAYTRRYFPPFKREEFSSEMRASKGVYRTV
jgi:hypothetical protein